MWRLNRLFRVQVEQLAAQLQQITGKNMELTYVDQGYTGEAAENAAAAHGIQLHVVKHTEAKRGFVLLHHCWVVESSFACLMLTQLFKLLNPSS